MTEDEIRAAVRSCIAEGLFLGEEEVTPDTALFGDLAAESIDMLDILFRIERRLGVRLKGSDISEHILGMSQEEFADADGRVTAKGAAQLRKVMPQVDIDAMEGKVDAMALLNLFNVRNLTDLVVERVAVSAV
jgi:acyl carrier protein